MLGGGRWGVWVVKHYRHLVSYAELVAAKDAIN